QPFNYKKKESENAGQRQRLLQKEITLKKTSQLQALTTENLPQQNNQGNIEVQASNKIAIH
ncbi:hypothetical protein N9T98_00920, partial [bacterium]|nr:hypothetical protein [bacterium]